MDLSDLPESALRLIAEAEIEAKYILRESGVSVLFSTTAPMLDGEPEPNESSEGRNQAARHLFGVTAKHVWERVQPDLDVFKFHPDAGVLTTVHGSLREQNVRQAQPSPRPFRLGLPSLSGGSNFQVSAARQSSGLVRRQAPVSLPILTGRIQVGLSSFCR
jgi:hypothetical protein